MFHIVYIFIYIYYMYICVPCMIHSASWSHWCFETAAFLQALVPALQWLLGLCETSQWATLEIHVTIVSIDIPLISIDIKMCCA